MALRLDNRPLLGTIDRDLFVTPSIMPTLKAAVNRKLNVLVLGPPGSGKTTLLRSLAADHGDAQPAVYVDLGPAQDAMQALVVIADALGQRWGAFGDMLRSSVVPETTPSGTLLRLARRLGEAPSSLILVDAPPGEGNAHTLFGRLRDVLWEQGHQWVVAANDVLRDELTRPPANAFFDVHLDLAPLSPAEQHEFLVRRLGPEPNLDVDAMVDQTDGLPRSLVELARIGCALGPIHGRAAGQARPAARAVGEAPGHSIDDRGVPRGPRAHLRLGSTATRNARGLWPARQAGSARA